MNNVGVVPDRGVYNGIPFDVYRSWPCVSASRLRAMETSPEHYRTAEEVVRPPTEAQRQGAFLHKAVLEPDDVRKTYAPEPVFDDIRRPDGTAYTNPKATTQYKQRYAAWREAVGDLEPVQAEWFDAAALIKRRVLDHPVLRELILDPCKEAEVSVVFESRHGLLCKARFDLWLPHRNTIVDLKTTRDLMAFEKAIYRYSYFTQAAFYTVAAQAITGNTHEYLIAAVEKEPPYGLRAAPIEAEAIGLGLKRIRTWLDTLSTCLESNRWPGPESPEVWRLPEWAYAEQTT